MYLHLGANTVIKKDDIVGIFDLDNTTVAKISRWYLYVAQRRGQIINITEELPKSFIVCVGKDKKQKIYLSQLSAATLKKRNNFLSVTDGLTDTESETEK